MSVKLLVLTTLLLLLSRAYLLAASVPIDDFRAVGKWSLHGDGGYIEISSDTVNTRGGNPSMRLYFSAEKHGWGNAACSVKLPPNACGIEFDVFISSISPRSVLDVWLFEADGDAYTVHTKPEGKNFDELGTGWHSVYVPLSSLRFDPRGNKKREPLTIDKMLIGLGFTRADVSIANLSFRALEGQGKKESRTQDLKIGDGTRGRVAILTGGFPARPGNADPGVLAAALDGSGYGVTLLQSGDLADSAVLDVKNFDCVILPYGPSYPHAAFGSIRAYLKAGGSFVSMGGYAFDEPCRPGDSGKLISPEATVTAEDLAGEPGANQLNTRYGEPADTLGLQPDQIGVFDPCYHLKNAVGFAAAPTQFAVPDSLEGKMELEGYAACSMLGSNSPVEPQKWGRHIALVDALDSFGRPRGNVGAIAHNYAGPYAKSSWAFFGVTNVDLFAKDGPMLPHLGSIVDAVVNKTYLHSLGTDFTIYKNGEPVKLSCTVADFGKRSCAGSVVFRVFDREGKQAFTSEPIDFRVKAGTTETLRSEFRPRGFASDLYRLTAEMSVGGKTVDAIESGFLAYDSGVAASGLHLELEGNYFHDGKRPILFSGTNITGAMFYSGNENPLVWDRDLAKMSENGINIMRIMHILGALTPEGAPRLKPDEIGMSKLPLKAERWFDGLIQLCQKHKVAVLFSHHAYGAVLTKEELEAERRFSKLIAARYKNVPGFLIDIQNEPNVMSSEWTSRKQWGPMNRDWNDFLRLKYKSDDALKSAWQISPPESPLGGVLCKTGKDSWDDIRTLDEAMFSNYLAQRWVVANYAGLKEGNPRVPVTVGFLQEYWALNKLMCMDSLDFADMHSYTSVEDLRADLKLFDRRFEGKSMSLGEFGSVADHSARNEGRDSTAEDYNRYLLTGHYLFGEGGSFLANWCWKDMDDVVFPWGINYGCGGPRKDMLLGMRNQSLLLRQVRPVYRSPEVFLVAPANTMVGGKSSDVVRMLYRHIDSLLDARADFGTIDDEHLSALPASAKLLIYPIPFNIPDEAYEQLKSFVERGGKLCITGDISYDSLRKRTCTIRLKELCGVRYVSENYPNIGWEADDKPCINVEAVNATRSGEMFVNKLGQGEVYYTPRPLGVSREIGQTVFSAPLADLGARAVVHASEGHAFRIPETGGGFVIFLVNPAAEEKWVTVNEPNAEVVRLQLKGNGTGFVRCNRAGKVTAVEAQGPVIIGPDTRIDIKGHIALYSCDGRDLLSSRNLVVLPFGGGEIDLGVFKLGSDAVVQIGDVASGKWRALSESSARSITASGATAFDIRVIGRKGDIGRLGAFVASEMMLR